MKVIALWELRASDRHAVGAAGPCGSCERPIGFLLFSPINTINSALTRDANTDLLSVGWDLVTTWPVASKPEALEHCTPAVERVFLQATSAFKRGELDSAGAMFRKTLEVALKEKAPDVQGEWLAQRIRTLANNGVLTKDLADWAEGIKAIGDPATHDVDEPAADDVRNLAGVTELVLRYLFTLPGMVAAMRERPPEPEAEPAA